MVAPAKRGRPKGSKDKPKEVVSEWKEMNLISLSFQSNPPNLSAMDEGNAPMGNRIIDPARMYRKVTSVERSRFN